jgi:hypothetical protein
MYVHCYIEVRWRNQCCSGKEVSFKYNNCVITSLVNHHVKRMRCIVLRSVACLLLLYFATLSHQRHEFQKFSEKMY